MTLTLDQQTLAYLESRGIDPDVAIRHCDTVQGKLAFRYVKNEKLLYHKLRLATDDGKSFRREPAGTETILFNHDVLREATNEDTLIVTEGEIDALSWLSAGFNHVVSVPDGAQTRGGEGDIVPSQDKAFRWLWDGDKLKAGLDRYRRIFLAVDADEAGTILRDELAIRFGPERCSWTDYHGHGKDANDILKRWGPKGLVRIFDTAKPYTHNALTRFQDLPSTAALRTYEIGMGPLGEHHLKLRAPSLVVLTGPPGHGKTQFATVLGATLAARYNLRGAVMSFEDDASRIFGDLCNFYRGETGCVDAADQAAWVNDMFLFTGPHNDPHEERGLDWLNAQMESAAVHYNCRWVIIDPWNEIEHMFSKGESIAVYLNRALRHLKTLARRYNMIVFLCAHPDKSAGRSHIDINQWSLYDIDGGAAWNNKADHGIVVFREEDDKKFSDAWIKVCKSKVHSTMGKPGMVLMSYNPAMACYQLSVRHQAALAAKESGG